MLFGVNYAVKHSLTDARSGKPGFVHFALSSKIRDIGGDMSKAHVLPGTAGSVASILVACPLDVVKTRLQSGNYAGCSAFRIIADITAKEGLGAFFKGSVTFELVLSPRMRFDSDSEGAVSWSKAHVLIYFGPVFD